MFVTIDTETLQAICAEVKAVKETGKLPDWMYNGMCWSGSQEKKIVVGAAVVCWYEFCLQSLEPAKPLEDWCRTLSPTIGFSAVQDLIKAGLLKCDYIHNDLVIRHSRNITRKKEYKTVLQPQTGRRYEHKTREGRYGLVMFQVADILEAVGVHWNNLFWNNWSELREGV